MDQLTKDPDVANGIIELLRTKLEAAKASQKAAETENEELRRRIRQLQDKEASGIKRELENIDMLSLACGLGQCQSNDRAEWLSVQLQETEEQLAAAQKAVRAKDALIAELDAENARVEEETNSRLHALENARNPSQSFQTLDGESTLAEEIPEEETQEVGGWDKDLDLERENEEEEEADADTFPKCRAIQPCLPLDTTPQMLPHRIKKIAEGGICYWPHRASLDETLKFCTMSGPQVRFRSADRQWIEMKEMLAIANNIRELFYRHDDGDICYAGTFRAAAIIEYRKEEYRELPAKLRKSMLAISFEGKVSDNDRDMVTNRFWSGQTKMQYLKWERIGFNSQLFRAMRGWRKSVIEKTVLKERQKRRSDETDDTYPAKKAKVKR